MYVPFHSPLSRRERGRNRCIDFTLVGTGALCLSLLCPIVCLLCFLAYPQFSACYARFYVCYGMHYADNLYLQLYIFCIKMIMIGIKSELAIRATVQYKSFIKM